MSTSELFRQQYALIRDARGVLLAYCAELAPNHFLYENDGFGRGGSVRNLLVHIANTYELWIGHRALKRAPFFTTYDSVQTAEDAMFLFDSVDQLMEDFFDHLEDTEEVNFDVNGTTRKAPRTRLYTHVITHEFHHKGQILSVTRQLGYTPVDTDVMR